MERVSLAGVSLSSEQASSLLVRINVMIKMLSRLWKSLQVRAAERREKNVLQRLNLSGNSLSQVPPMVLAGLSNNIKPQCRRVVCLSFVVRQHLKSKSEIFFFLIAPKINAEVCNEMTLEAWKVALNEKCKQATYTTLNFVVSGKKGVGVYVVKNMDFVGKVNKEQFMIGRRRSHLPSPGGLVRHQSDK